MFRRHFINNNDNNYIINNNEIHYKTTHYSKIYDDVITTNGVLIKNTYNSGIGVLTFDRDITYVETKEYQPAIKELILPDSVININAICDSFYNIEYVKLSNNITELPDDSFWHCYNLKNIKLPNSLINIGKDVFYDCNSLTELIIPKNVEYIENNIIQGCRYITRLIVDENNKYYDSRENCNAIIETNTNTLISGCSTTIIPNTINAIGDRAFYRIDTIDTIKYNGTKAQWETIIKGAFWNYVTLTIKCTDGDIIVPIPF